ncbi:MAG: GNAT family N-acetyltransferase [Thermomicrobiales bacterium]
MTAPHRAPRIRPATTADVPRMKELGVLGWETTYHTFVSPANRAMYLAGPFWSLDRLMTIVSDQACLALVAGNRPGQVAGFLTIEPVEDGGVELTRLYVDPAARGGGIGVTLVEASIVLVRLRHARTMLVNVFADNHAGRRFYERVGFTFTRLEPCAIGDQIVGDAWYEREVSGDRYHDTIESWAIVHARYGHNCRS